MKIISAINNKTWYCNNKSIWQNKKYIKLTINHKKQKLFNKINKFNKIVIINNIKSNRNFYNNNKKVLGKMTT